MEKNGSMWKRIRASLWWIVIKIDTFLLNTCPGVLHSSCSERQAHLKEKTLKIYHLQVFKIVSSCNQGREKFPSFQVSKKLQPRQGELLVRFPNWHVPGCPEKVGWGTRLGNTCRQCAPPPPPWCTLSRTWSSDWSSWLPWWSCRLRCSSWSWWLPW